MLLEPHKQILIHLLPIRLIQDLMAVACVESEGHILYTGPLIFLINLPYPFSEIPYRVIRTGYKTEQADSWESYTRFLSSAFRSCLQTYCNMHSL